MVLYWLGWSIAAVALGLACGKLVNMMIHSARSKTAIERILWQEAAERAALARDVHRMADALEGIAQGFKTWMG